MPGNVGARRYGRPRRGHPVVVIRGRHAARGSGRGRAGECRARRGRADVCPGSAVRAAARGRRDGVGRRAQRAVHGGARQRDRSRGGRVLPGPTGAAGLRLRRVHVPGQHELRARRRLGAGGRGHRRCRSSGNRGRAPALGTHAALALRPGSPVPQRPPRAGAARRRALPVGGPQPFGGAVGARRPARPHRMGRRRDELAQRRLALLPGRLRAGARAGAARAVRAATARAAARRATTTAGPTGRSTSRAWGVGSGRCSTRRPTSGLQIVHARKRFGAVDRYGRAELCLDVTAGPAAEALEIAPALRFAAAEEADTDALPILFLGAEGHGVVHVSRAQSRGGSRPRALAVPAGPPRHPGSAAAAPPGPGEAGSRCRRTSGRTSSTSSTPG